MDFATLTDEQLDAELARTAPAPERTVDYSQMTDAELDAMLAKQTQVRDQQSEDRGQTGRTDLTNRTDPVLQRLEAPNTVRAVADPADFIPMPENYVKANLTAPPADLQRHEMDLNTILNWDGSAPEERARIREEETQAMARLMNENPPIKAMATASGASVVGKTAQALVNLTGGRDEYPTFLHAVQAVNDRGLAQGDSFKNRFFTETLPKLAADSPLYMTMAYLTRRWGTFAAMNALEQGLDKYNTGKEFDEQKLKTSLLTDMLFRFTGVPAPGAGGALKRLGGEALKVVKGTAILTGTGVVDKGLQNEEITLRGTAEDALGNALLVSVMHVPQLVKAGQAGLIETAATKAGMPQADATLFANQIVSGKKVGAMRAATDALKGDESKIKQFARAFRAEFGEAGLVNRAQYAANKAEQAAADAAGLRRAKQTFSGTTPQLPENAAGLAKFNVDGRGVATPAPKAAPTAEAVVLSRSQAAGGVRPGAATTVYGSKGTTYPATYAVVPRSLIQASHESVGFGKNPAYPLENTRDYSKIGEQEKVIAVRNGFDPARHVTDSPDAAVGPSMVARVIGEDGTAQLTVLGGNNREMAIATMGPEKQQALADFTNERVDRFGVDSLKSPDEELVRYMGEFDLRTAGSREKLQKIVDSLNPSPGKVQNLAEMATIDAANGLPIEQLAQVPMDVAPADAQAFLANAIKAGALDHNLRSQIAEHPQQAAEYVRRLMVNAAYRSPELADFHASTGTSSAATRGLVESAVPALVEMRAKGQNELADAFTRSMQVIVNDYAKTGKLNDALMKAAQQMDLDPRYGVVNDVAARLGGLVELNKKGAVDAEATIEAFTGFWKRMQTALQQNDGQPDMFGAGRSSEEVIRGLLQSVEQRPDLNMVKEDGIPYGMDRTDATGRKTQLSAEEIAVRDAEYKAPNGLFLANPRKLIPRETDFKDPDNIEEMRKWYADSLSDDAAQDPVPIAVVKTDAGYEVLDGHHRRLGAIAANAPVEIVAIDESELKRFLDAGELELDVVAAMYVQAGVPDGAERIHSQFRGGNTIKVAYELEPKLLSFNLSSGSEAGAGFQGLENPSLLSDTQRDYSDARPGTAGAVIRNIRDAHEGSEWLGGLELDIDRVLRAPTRHDLDRRMVDLMDSFPETRQNELNHLFNLWKKSSGYTGDDELDFLGRQELSFRREQAQTALTRSGASPSEQNIGRLQNELEALSRAAGTDRNAGGSGGVRSQPAAPAAAGSSLRERLKSHVHTKAFKAIQASTTRDLTPNEQAILREATRNGVPLSAIIAEHFEGQATIWPITGAKITGPADVAALAMPLRSPFQESIKVAYVDSKNRVIQGSIVSVGTLNSSLFHPREIFKAPPGTAGLVLLHNHPSGDPMPSAADIKITKKAIEAGKVMGIKVLDHVITNGAKFFSMRETGFADFTADKAHFPYVKVPEGMKAQEFTVPVDELMQPKAPWEMITTDERTQIDGPSVAADVARRLRQANPTAMTITLLDTKQKISGMVVFPMSGNPQEVAKVVMTEFSRHGAAMGVIVDLPMKMSDEGAEKYIRAIKMASEQMEFKLLDVLFSAQSGGDIVASGRDYGLINETMNGIEAAKPPWSVAEDAVPYGTEGKPEMDAPIAIRFTEAGLAKAAKMSDWQKMKMGGLEFVRPMEMPEILKLSRALGVEPNLKKLPKAYGHMKGIPGAPQIVLDPRIFKDPAHAARVFAHEIGHLVDFMPDETMKRGNILGRLFSLREFRKNVLRGETDLTAKALQKEIFELSKWWRPFDESKATKSFLAYRKSSVECYADALSVLLNSPAELKSRAPQFWNTFFKTIERKPEVKADLLGLWDQLQRPESDLLRDRSADIRRMFGRGEEILLRKAKERELRYNTFRGWGDRFKMQYSDVYYPIVKRVRALKAQGKNVPWHEDPEALFDEHPLAEGNKSYRFMDRLYKKIVQPLEAAEMSLDQLGEYMFLNRVMNEVLGVTVEAADGEVKINPTGRQALANPLGMQPAQARKQLLSMRLGLGIEKMTLLDDFARTFQDHVFDVIQEAAEVGTYSREYVEGTLAGNKYNYAAFAVLDHLEHNEHIPAGIRKQVGTLKDIANPFTATVLKMQTLMRWNQVNKVQSAAIDVMAEWGEAARAPVKMAGGRVFPKPAPSGKVLFTRMVNGNPEHWYVDPEVPAMFEHSSPAEQDAILQVINTGFRKIIYPMWITYNPAFNMLMNPVRDFRRTHRNLPINSSTVSAWKLLKEYAKGRKVAIRRLKHESDPLIAEMLENFAIGSPFDSFVSNVYRDDYFGKMLQKFNMMPEEEQAGWKKQVFIKPLIKLLKEIEFQGQIMESLPKIAAYKILTKDLGWDPRTAANYTRSYLGTPNYMKRGKHAYGGGTLMPFFNIFLRGWEADLKNATNPKTRFGFWWKYASTNGMWTMMKALGAAGLFGVALKEWFDGVSEYNKTNYDVIPLGKVSGGEFGRKSFGLRLPKDEFSRFVDGVLYKAVYGMATGDITEQRWNQVFAIGAGQLPGATPFYQVASSWTEYMSGNNPYDYFYNSPILTNDQWLEGGWEGMKGMIGWTGKNLGIQNYVRFNPNADSVTESILSSTPVLNKALFVSDYGYREQQQGEERAEQRANAIVRNDMSQDVVSAKNEYYRLRRIGDDKRTPEQQDRYEAAKEWFSTEYAPAWEEILYLLEEGNMDAAKRTAKAIRTYE